MIRKRRLDNLLAKAWTEGYQASVEDEYQQMGCSLELCSCCENTPNPYLKGAA